MQNKTMKKIISGLLALVTVLTTFFTSASPVFASSLALDEPTNYYYTGISPHTGYAMTHNTYVLKMDGKKVFCVESRIPLQQVIGICRKSYKLYL